uniref:Uncharacterized protein n=1 Tax=Daphnia galeata TaxID=27404 RepID=A0A8J2RCC1_9CRUS|nr:unnamed protein product [Daphnia galeata]
MVTSELERRVRHTLIDLHGKRICLGEPLGQDRMFFFVAFLVKTFEFQVRPQRIAFNAGTRSMQI